MHELNKDYQPIITDSAVAAMIDDLEQDMVRIFVQLDRQTGFSYGMTHDNEQNEDDLIFVKELGGKRLKLVIDSMSIQYLKGATIDFKADEGGGAFVITNPNAA